MVAFADQSCVIWQQVCEGQAHSVDVFSKFEAGIRWHFVESICKPKYRHTETVLSVFLIYPGTLFTCVCYASPPRALHVFVFLFLQLDVWAWQTDGQWLEGLTLKLFLNPLQEVDIFPPSERSDLNRRDYKHDLCQSINQSRSYSMSNFPTSTALNT